MSESFRAVESDEGSEQALGREVVRAFLLALRTLRTHGPTNDISVAAIRACAGAINHACATQGRFELHAVEDFLYLQEIRLRPERRDARLFEALLGEFQRRDMGGLISPGPVEETNVLILFQAMHRHQGGGEGFHALREELSAVASPFLLETRHAIPSGAAHHLTGGDRRGGIFGSGTPETAVPNGGAEPSARIHTLHDRADSDGSPAADETTSGPSLESSPDRAERATPLGSRSSKKSGVAVPKLSILSNPNSGQENPEERGPRATRNSPSKRAFFTAVSVYQSMHQGLHLGKSVEVRHAKRTVQNLVDQVLAEEFAVLGLTALKTQDNYSFFHSVNVAVLAIGLGKRVGLEPNQLVELGTGALFHDIGKVRIPASILRKPGKLTAEERAVIQLHPQMGVQELLRIGGLDLQLHPAMIGCFEHHMCVSTEGDSYPRVPAYRPHVYGRIISIADCFDALSTRRVYMDRHRSKGQALAWMMTQAGKKFDPTLLRLFVNQVGIHPVGSVVRLRSGRIGVVLRTPEAPGHCHLPIVAIVDPVTSNPEPEPLDLSQQTPGGAFVDEVLQTLEADEAGIDLTRVLA